MKNQRIIICMLIVFSQIALYSFKGSEQTIFEDPKLEKCAIEQLEEEGKSLDDIQQLTELSCIGITSLSGIENLTNLEYLIVSGIQISDISYLSDLTNLRDLSIIGGDYSDISYLSNLTKLESLSLSGDVTNLAPLEKLVNLETLYLPDNNISDITVLSKLTNLNTLYIVGNHITDFSPIKDLQLEEFHGYGQTVDVSEFDQKIDNYQVILKDGTTTNVDITNVYECISAESYTNEESGAVMPFPYIIFENSKCSEYTGSEVHGFNFQFNFKYQNQVFSIISIFIVAYIVFSIILIKTGKYNILKVTTKIHLTKLEFVIDIILILIALISTGAMLPLRLITILLIVVKLILGKTFCLMLASGTMVTDLELETWRRIHSNFSFKSGNTGKKAKLIDYYVCGDFPQFLKYYEENADSIIKFRDFEKKEIYYYLVQVAILTKDRELYANASLLYKSTNVKNARINKQYEAMDQFINYAKSIILENEIVYEMKYEPASRLKEYQITYLRSLNEYNKGNISEAIKELESLPVINSNEFYYIRKINELKEQLLKLNK